MKNKSSFVIVLCLLFLWACKKSKTPIYSSGKEDSVIINTTNTNITNHLDSVGLIRNISKQKLQAVYDMAALKRRNPKAQKEIEEPIYEYFFPTDTISVTKIYKDLDSVKAFYAQVDNIEILYKNNSDSDTLGKINYNLYYFNKDKKYIGTDKKSVSYRLQKQPEKLKQQFTFYLYNLSEKDTISEGVTQ